MSNAPSFGKTIFLSLLLMGAAVGFAGCTTRSVQGPVGCAGATGTAHTVNITEDVTKKKITIDNDHVHVIVENCDQVVWVWASEPTGEFEVSLKLEHPPVSAPPNPFAGPPFQGTGSGGQMRFIAESTRGTLASGHAILPAKGRVYKFTITAIDRPDLEPLDPHVRFD